MIETNKGTSLVVMILSVIVLIIISFFVYWQFFSSMGEKENINFIKEGNIVINNPGLIENVWYLIYEAEGAPANSIKLFFNEDSACKNKTNSCSDLNVGERVEIRGIENSGEVLVKDLRLIEALN